MTTRRFIRADGNGHRDQDRDQDQDQDQDQDEGSTMDQPWPPPWACEVSAWGRGAFASSVATGAHTACFLYAFLRFVVGWFVLLGLFPIVDLCVLFTFKARGVRELMAPVLSDGCAKRWCWVKWYGAGFVCRHYVALFAMYVCCFVYECY